MAINVSCPSCGAKRSLSDAFRGLSVLCPKCGTRFTATGSSDSTFFSLSSGNASLSGEEAHAVGSEGGSGLDPALLRELLGTATLSSSGSTEVPASAPIERPAPPVTGPEDPPTRLPGGPQGGGATPRIEHVLPPESPSRLSPHASESKSGLREPGPPPGLATKSEYKVLTREKLWFSGEFNPAGLEEALNSYAQQGWRLKSTQVLTVTGPGPEGTREELVVILER